MGSISAGIVALYITIVLFELLLSCSVPGNAKHNPRHDIRPVRCSPHISPDTAIMKGCLFHYPESKGGEASIFCVQEPQQFHTSRPFFNTDKVRK